MSSKWVEDPDPLIDPLIRVGEDGATEGAAVREMRLVRYLRYDWTSQITSASISELKARLSAYIDIVRDGDEVLVTDRGRLIARLMPIRAADQEDGRRFMLLRSGGLRGPTTTLAHDFFARARPMDDGGDSLAVLLDERAD